MQTGVIIRIFEDRCFGFLHGDGEDRDTFFHSSTLVDLDFDPTLEQRRVRFQTVEANGRTRASVVQPE